MPFALNSDFNNLNTVKLDKSTLIYLKVGLADVDINLVSNSSYLILSTDNVSRISLFVQTNGYNLYDIVELSTTTSYTYTTDGLALKIHRTNTKYDNRIYVLRLH